MKSEDRIAALIAQVRDSDIRTMLGICETSRKYPKDCIVDGALEKLINYILKLEQGAPLIQPKVNIYPAGMSYADVVELSKKGL